MTVVCRIIFISYLFLWGIIQIFGRQFSLFVNLRTSEVILFSIFLFFYWHFVEILWIFIFLIFYKLFLFSLSFSFYSYLLLIFSWEFYNRFPIFVTLFSLFVWLFVIEPTVKLKLFGVLSRINSLWLKICPMKITEIPQREKPVKFLWLSVGSSIICYSRAVG